MHASGMDYTHTEKRTLLSRKLGGWRALLCYTRQQRRVDKPDMTDALQLTHPSHFKSCDLRIY